MNRLLLDQGLAPYAAAILRKQGFDAVHVSEIGMEQADDLAIQADLIQVVSLRCQDALREGAAVSADGETIRLRRLPLT